MTRDLAFFGKENAVSKPFDQVMMSIFYTFLVLSPCFLDLG